MSLTIVPAELPAMLWIANHLRQADRVELGLENTEDLELLLLHSLNISTWCKVGLVDGIPAIAYGVAPSDNLVEGVCWMLATDRIRHVRRRFIRDCGREVEKMLSVYPYIHNHVHVGNAIALRWLRWLGFTFDPKPVGPGEQFLHFWKEV